MLDTGDTTHHETEDVIKKSDHKRDCDGDENNDESVRNRRPIAWPDDVSELFANMLQIGEW